MVNRVATVAAGENFPRAILADLRTVSLTNETIYHFFVEALLFPRRDVENSNPVGTKLIFRRALR